jgi:hypothetical protein
MRKLRFCPIVFLLFVSLCFASMTIYFKDGTSREVHKITFNGNTAELYLIDGSMMHVPVETLDLPSSGVGAPVGTYGTSAVSGQRSVTSRTTVLGDPRKQERLKEEWDDSEKTAIASKTIGSIQKGDTVKIVGETSANTSPNTKDYYDPSEYYYNPQSHRYEFKKKNLDHAYIVVYKNPDGTFGKRLFDAATFQEYFDTPRVKQLPKPMPEYPVIPDREEPVLPGPSAAPPEKQEAPQATPDTQAQSADQQNPQTETQTQSQSPPAATKRKPLIAFIIFLVVLVGLGFGAWFLIQRTQRPYIDASKFKQYEEDLREFEIAIWLRNGKTADQLMEICLKKFYQDHPKALAICNKMLKGSQKGLMLPFITGQTGKSSAEASVIYDQINGQIETIRKLIREVSLKTGSVPLKPAVSAPQNASAPETSKPASAAAKANPPAPPAAPRSAPQSADAPPAAPVAANAVRQSSPHLIEPDSPMRSGSDLPSYASSVLNQITFLSSKEEK